MSHLASFARSRVLRGVETTTRNLQTIARTINLADSKTCERPRRVQKLVSADVTRSCPHPADSVPIGFYGPTRAVPVRVCKRTDLERACQPKFCDCPQKSAPKTIQQVLCGWAILGAKGALAAGLVYWTVSEGIWGDGADTEDFYFRIRDTIASDPAFDDMSLPHLEYIKFKILDSYNHAVIKVMDILVGVPMRIHKKIIDAFYPCKPIEDDEEKE